MQVTDFKNGYRLYTLKSAGLELQITDLGASLVQLCYPDKNGALIDIVLGFDDSDGYLYKNTYFGANVGRCANRIAGAAFTLNGLTYKLDNNDGPNCLHSGFDCYCKRRYKTLSYDESHITFQLESPHLDQGFPGRLLMTVTYTLLDPSGFLVTYEATPDSDTPIVMTNHSYFNLNGEGNGTILDHTLTLHASHFTPIDENLIPEGTVKEIKDTPMDFTTPHRVGDYIDRDYHQLRYAGGYDHNYIVAFNDCKERMMAEAEGEISGIKMTVFSDYPGLQFYSGNFLDGVAGKNGHIYRKRAALCLEPQFFPNAVNIPAFPTPIVQKGQKYKKVIRYKFSS